MPYGEIRVDSITFTNGGVDTTVTVSGLAASTTGNLTVTGTVSGNVANFISGSFSTRVSGLTVAGTTGTFTSLTGTTTQGTTTTFTTGSFTSLTGTTTQGTTATYTTGSFTSLTGTTTTGTTANFASGVFTTQVSGTTITGTTVAATTGTFTTVTGGTTTITSGVFAVGSAAAPSISFSSDPNTGIYSPGGDQVAISTNGSGRLFVDASGNVSIGATGAESLLTVRGANARIMVRDEGTPIRAQFDVDSTNSLVRVGSRSNHPFVFTVQDTERMRLTATGLGIGTSSPTHLLSVGIGGSGGSTYPIALGQTAGVPSARIDGYKVDGSYAGELHLYTTTGPGAQNRAVTIDSSQRVGIGTTNPTVPLFVNGEIYAKASSGGDNDYGVAICSGPSLANANAHKIRAGGGVGQLLIIETQTAGNNGQTLFFTNGAERARIDSSGRLLVGTSSASANARGLFQGNPGSNSGNVFLAHSINNPVPNNITLGALVYTDSGHTPAATIIAQTDGTTWTSGVSQPTRLVFSTCPDSGSSPVERMRIESNGRTTAKRNTNGGATLVAHNTANTSTDEGLQVLLESSAIVNTASFIACAQTNVGTRFNVLGTGNVQNTNNSYAGISDVKLKENIVDSASQWDDIKSLRVRNYSFKVGPSHRQIGLIAQEVETVSPGLVVETPDRDTDGNDLGTTTKAVQYSVLYMKAVKALQEAMERIETLEAKVAALESA